MIGSLVDLAEQISAEAKETDARLDAIESRLLLLLDALDAQEKRAAADGVPSFSIRVNACRRDARKALEGK